MSKRRIIPRPGRTCLSIDGRRIDPGGEDFELTTPALMTWAVRLVDVHQDATFGVDESVPASPMPEPVVELAADASAPEAKPEARSRKGRAE